MGRRVLVQRYGEANRRLCEALESRGAAVHEIATYRWALPKDTGPLMRLLDELAASRVDAVVFTSAVQIQNLYAVAERANRAGASRAAPECADRRLDRAGVHAGALEPRHHADFRSESAEAGTVGDRFGGRAEAALSATRLTRNARIGL